MLKLSYLQHIFCVSKILLFWLPLFLFVLNAVFWSRSITFSFQIVYHQRIVPFFCVWNLLFWLPLFLFFWMQSSKAGLSHFSFQILYHQHIFPFCWVWKSLILASFISVCFECSLLKSFFHFSPSRFFQAFEIYINFMRPMWFGCLHIFSSFPLQAYHTPFSFIVCWFPASLSHVFCFCWPGSCTEPSTSLHGRNVF